MWRLQHAFEQVYGSAPDLAAVLLDKTDQVEIPDDWRRHAVDARQGMETISISHICIGNGDLDVHALGFHATQDPRLGACSLCFELAVPRTEVVIHDCAILPVALQTPDTRAALAAILMPSSVRGDSRALTGLMARRDGRVVEGGGVWGEHGRA